MNMTSIAKQLNESLASVVDRRQRVARHVEHRDEPLPANFSEQAIELEDAETMSALAVRLATEESELRSALARLELGTYGRCQACGLSIDEKRLAVLPTTSTCIRCASGA
jgi:DnaK suppressor protein